MLRLSEDRRQANRLLDGSEIEAAAVRLAPQHPEIEAIWLFGSYAHGRPRRTSDVDLAVMASPGFASDPHYRFSLSREAEADLSVPVDIIVLHGDLDRALLWEALQKPTMLFARNIEDANAYSSRLRSLVRDEWPRMERRWERTLRWAQEHQHAGRG